MIFLDTNVVSALMRRELSALDRLAQHRPGDVYLSSPVAAEINYGLRRLQPGSKRRVLLEHEYERLRRRIRWADWTESAAREFGSQKARLAVNGELIEDMDLIVGSIAIAAGAALATYNIAHLGRLVGLTVADWGESKPSL